MASRRWRGIATLTRRAGRSCCPSRSSLSTAHSSRGATPRTRSPPSPRARRASLSPPPARAPRSCHQARRCAGLARSSTSGAPCSATRSRAAATRRSSIALPTRSTRAPRAAGRSGSACAGSASTSRSRSRCAPSAAVTRWTRTATRCCSATGRWRMGPRARARTTCAASPRRSPRSPRAIGSAPAAPQWHPPEGATLHTLREA
mmetsp:Transcript_36827/g.115748  ORF Transcript_36827/g.115748 Transcript_36827/m.115748 type:complete len:204 (-) Transcript_36827:223-834(-)